jgi:hypothetical protein
MTARIMVLLGHGSLPNVFPWSCPQMAARLLSRVRGNTTLIAASVTLRTARVRGTPKDERDEQGGV